MAQIDKNIASHLGIGYDSGKTYVVLNANKPIIPYQVTYPISWIGYVCGYEVKIIQLTEDSSSIEDYEFLKYPSKLDYLKGIVIKLIDEYLKKVLD